MSSNASSSMSAVLGALPAGTLVLDRYEILSRVGAGGFGVVYKARQLNTGQLVAIKMLKQDLREGSEDLETQVKRFTREMELIAVLNHPHIVALKDSGKVDDDWVMILEYVEGTELAERITQGAMEPGLVKRVICQALEALIAAHRRGVIHRDLKPSNIMLTGSADRPLVRVLDFGIATFAHGEGGEGGALTQTHVVLGTPAYMAPEQIQKDEASPSIDVYSMGLILLECLSGRRAVTGKTSLDVAMKQLNEPVPISTELRKSAFGSVILKACAKYPEDRYTSAEQMLEAIEALDLEALAPPERSKVVLYATLGLAIVLLMTAGVLLGLKFLGKKPAAAGGAETLTEEPGATEEFLALQQRARRGATDSLAKGAFLPALKLAEPVANPPDTIYAAMADLERDGREMLKEFCDCYTDNVFGGSREDCESQYKLLKEIDCAKVAYEVHPKGAIEHLRCTQGAIVSFKDCVAGCPALDSAKGGQCLAKAGDDANTCRSESPLGLLVQIDSCMEIALKSPHGR